MLPLRRVLALLAAVLAFCVVQPAQAQLAPTVALAATPVVHSIPRTGFRLNTQINYADCRDDDVLDFSVVLTNRSSFALQAWAGTGCDQLTNRTTTGATLCWKLYDSLPNTTVPTVDIHVRDLLAGKTIYGTGTTTTTTTDDAGVVDAGVAGTGGATSTGGAGGIGGTAGATTVTTGTITLPTGTLVTGTGPQACVDTSDIPVATALTVYFMLVDGNSNIQGTFAQWAAMYKLLAPNPPDTVTANVGDTLLPIQFNYVDNQSNDTTINGYQFFCDPPPGPAGAADAGIVPVATDAGEVMPDCQASTELSAGSVADPKFACGSASLSATAGNAVGLVNGVSYHVGVSATDTYANVGKLSTLACEVPQPITGFFKAYRAAGGAGGGGFCSFSMKREPMPLLALLGLASCLVLRRRRVA
jgi:hypothetical protein